MPVKQFLQLLMGGGDDDHSCFCSLIRQDAAGAGLRLETPQHAAKGPCPWRWMLPHLSPAKPEVGPWR